MRKRNYTQSSLRTEMHENGKWWIVFLTYKMTRYKLYCTDTKLINEYHQENENEKNKTERRLRMLCKLQGTKQKIDKKYLPNPIIWENVE